MALLPCLMPEESVYGKRDGALQGLALIYKEKGNAVRFTPGWKTGVIREVEMLARSDMFKPDVPCSAYHLETWKYASPSVLTFILFLYHDMPKPPWYPLVFHAFMPQVMKLSSQHPGFHGRAPSFGTSLYRHPGDEAGNLLARHKCFWVLVVLECWGHGSNNLIIVYDDKSVWGYLGWFWTMSITMRWVVDAILSVKASKHFGQPQWKPPCWSMCWHMMGFQPWLLCRTLGTKLF